MSASTPTPQRSQEIPAIPARWGFSKGLLAGAVIEVPILAATLWMLARFGVGDRDASFMRIMRLTAVFAGAAAILTGAGVGRLAAHASMQGGRRRAMFVAGRAHAAASAGLLVIAAIPHGHLPDHSWGWLPLPIAGLVAGAVAGLLIGLVCGGAAPVGFADVWSLARKPSVALRQLLGPEDLVRLGSALGTRTRNLFEGIFDPAPLPPKPSETPGAIPPGAIPPGAVSPESSPAPPASKDE